MSKAAFEWLGIAAGFVTLAAIIGMVLHFGTSVAIAIRGRRERRQMAEEWRRETARGTTSKRLDEYLEGRQ